MDKELHPYEMWEEITYLFPNFYGAKLVKLFHLYVVNSYIDKTANSYWDKRLYWNCL